MVKRKPTKQPTPRRAKAAPKAKAKKAKPAPKSGFDRAAANARLKAIVAWMSSPTKVKEPRAPKAKRPAAKAKSTTKPAAAKAKATTKSDGATSAASKTAANVKTTNARTKANAGTKANGRTKANAGTKSATTAKPTAAKNPKANAGTKAKANATKTLAKAGAKSKANEKPSSPKRPGPPQINLLGDLSSPRRVNHAIAPGAGAHALGRELGDVVAIEVEAEAALEAGDIQRAIAAYTRLIEASPTPIASHLIARGRAFYSAGDHLSAIGDFERGLAIEPHYPDLYFDKGKAELQAGRVGDADASFTQDLELDPSPISFYNRHLARKALGDRDGALVDLDCAIEGMPDEIPLRIARSILRASANDIEGAFADAEAAVALDPHDIALHDRSGRLALALGRNERAAEAYAAARRIAVESGELPDAEHLAGEALAIGQLGRHADALALLDRALAIAPDDATLHCNRGWMFHLVGRDTEALIDLDRAIALDPGYAKALQNRATIYTSRGDRSRALADYRTLDSLGHDVRDAIARLVAP